MKMTAGMAIDLRAPAILTVVMALTASCLVKDELVEGLRELRGEVTWADLEIRSDGSGTLDFNFHYEIGIVDESGIAEVMWDYALVTPTGEVLASDQQQMRDAELDLTQALARGDRPRKLEVLEGTLEPGLELVLWIHVYYREELLAELLSPVMDAPPRLGE